MIQTTLQSFRQLMATRDIHKELDVEKDEVLKIQKKINEHALDDPERWGITKELMHGWLKKAGYKKISETLWEENDRML